MIHLDRFVIVVVVLINSWSLEFYAKIVELINENKPKYVNCEYEFEL